MSALSQLKKPNEQIGASVSRLIRGARVHHGARRMIVLLLLAFGVFAILKPRIFLDALNLQNIGLAAPEIGVLALAVMLTMLTGGIDLSVVSIANGASITISTLYTAFSANSHGAAESLWPLYLLAALAVGLVGGLVNGLLIVYVKITPILATLGTMQIFNGLAVVSTGGKTLYGSPAQLTNIGQLAVGFVPVLFIVFVIVAIFVAVMINKTGLGRSVQLLGANPLASRYSGINDKRVLMLTYLVAGLLSGIAGIFFITRNPTASADYGSSYVLLVIVIAVLGGTNPNGGFGTVLGVVLATLTLQVVSSGFTAVRLSSYEYSIAQGVILVAVMLIDRIPWRRRRREAPVTETIALAATNSNAAQFEPKDR